MKFLGLETVAALERDLVEDLADDVKRGDEVGAAVADEQPHLLPDLGGQRMVPDERALAAVEHHVRRLLVDGLLHVEGLDALLAVLAHGVEVALHHVVLVVHRLEALRGLDQHQAVHAVADVHAHRRGGAVVDVDPLVQCLEGELRLVAGCRKARGRAAAGTDDAVQVNVVRHLVVGMIAEVKLDRVTLAHADEAAGHRAAEGPERVAHPFGDLLLHLPDLQLHDHPGRMAAVRRRRHVGRCSEQRVDRRTQRSRGVSSWRFCRGGVRDTRDAQRRRAGPCRLEERYPVHETSYTGCWPGTMSTTW